MSDDKGHVGIVGSGLIGKNWAMLFAGAGYRVRLYDVDTAQVEAALTFIREQLGKFEAEGLLRGKLPAAQQAALVSGCSDLGQCVRGAVHVQECVPEVLALKQKVFAELDKLVEGDTVLASSSSAQPASLYTEDLGHRAQCLVAHPVNPPYLMPLVELVPAPWTRPEVVSRTRTLMTEIGQAPVTLKKEVAGFIQPRIQYAVIQECLRLIKDGVVSVEDVDKVLTAGLGMRYAFMGPLETAHLNAEGFLSYCDRYKDMIYGVATDEGPATPMGADSPGMAELCGEMEGLVPLDTLGARRQWRDEGIARLAKLRGDMDRADS